jgi:CheY-like chemotaxis protein
VSSSDLQRHWQHSIGNDTEQHAQSASDGQSDKTGVALGLSAASAGALEWRKKTVLLVDSNLRSRESRAKVMRSKGVHVDCVGSADAARVRLAADKYNLVLVDLGRDTDLAESLVQEIRGKNSRQLVGFLVGSPLFIAKSLRSAHSPGRHVPPPAVIEGGDSPSTPAATPSEFGQGIKKTEAAETA